MTDLLPRTPESADGEPLLDTLLREAVPEIKLALGDLIDRENQRAIPDRYQKMLPESTLVVTLRPDAAEAVQVVAAELERELTDSCMRHGSLYDRAYKVKLRAAPNPGAPLFRVSTRRGDEPEPELFVAPRRQPEPTPPAAAPAAVPGIPTGPSAAAVAAAAAENATVIAPQPAGERGQGTGDGGMRGEPAVVPEGPSIDPDATRLDGIEAPPEPAHTGGGTVGGQRFEPGRFEVVVESEEGDEKERFPVPGALTTVGRQTDNPELRSDVAITNAPHVSRRQLALVWAPRGDKVGFTVYNVGLNPLHVGEREVPGANVKGALELADLITDHTEWVAPGTEMVIGEHGPVLRIVDTREGAEGEAGEPEVEVDPDATRFG